MLTESHATQLREIKRRHRGNHEEADLIVVTTQPRTRAAE
jgi:hypothetical protein